MGTFKRLAEGVANNLFESNEQLKWFFHVAFTVVDAWEKVRYEPGSEFPQQLSDKVADAVKTAIRAAVR